MLRMWLMFLPRDKQCKVLENCRIIMSVFFEGKTWFANWKLRLLFDRTENKRFWSFIFEIFSSLVCIGKGGFCSVRAVFFPMHEQWRNQETKVYVLSCKCLFSVSIYNGKNGDIKFFKSKSMQSGFCFHCPKVSVMKSVLNK